MFLFDNVSISLTAHTIQKTLNYLTGIGHGTMVLTERLHFFISFCRRRNKDHNALANCGKVEFPELDMRIYKCELRNGTKDLIQVCSKFLPQTSRLIAIYGLF
jgi:hypothetical protein